MDALGARSLSKRLEQQRHWRQAEAVLDGRQPPVDPDSHELEGMDDGIRLYSLRNIGGQTQRVCKRLVDGMWQNGVIAEPDKPFAENLSSAKELEHVA